MSNGFVVESISGEGNLPFTRVTGLGDHRVHGSGLPARARRESAAHLRAAQHAPFPEGVVRKPPVRVRVIVVFPLAPCARLTAVGEAAIVYPPIEAAVTVSAYDVLTLVTPVPLAVMVGV